MAHLRFGAEHRMLSSHNRNPARTRVSVQSFSSIAYLTVFSVTGCQYLNCLPHFPVHFGLRERRREWWTLRRASRYGGQAD